MPTTLKTYRPVQSRPEWLIAEVLRRSSATVALIVEVWTEARELQRAARQRHPFIDW